MEATVSLAIGIGCSVLAIILIVAVLYAAGVFRKLWNLCLTRFSYCFLPRAESTTNLISDDEDVEMTVCGSTGGEPLISGTSTNRESVSIDLKEKDERNKRRREMINKFKTVYLQGGAENFGSHQPYLEELADYYCHRYGERIESEPESACWMDLFKAFTLRNSSAAANSCSLKGNNLTDKAWDIVNRFLGDNSNTTQLKYNSTIAELLEHLQEIRSELSGEVAELECLPKDSPFDCTKEMRDIVTKSNTKMVGFAKRIIDKSISCMKTTPPCGFSVVGIGSIGRGEATPYSDLEYIFLIEDEDKKPYFEKLAVMSYFIIGSLRETNLKVADVEELKGWFIDKRRCGFQIDGITKTSGNVPTGYGDNERRNEYIVTPDELIMRYNKVLDNPVEKRAHQGDLTAMMSYTKHIYPGNQKDEHLLEQFNNAKNEKVKSKRRLEIDQEMLDKDLEKFAFSPEYDVYSSGFTLNVKRLIYRFPSIVLLDIAIITNNCQADSWVTLDHWLSSAEHSSSSTSVANQMFKLLALACYTRLRCYLSMNSSGNTFRIYAGKNRIDGISSKTLHFKEILQVWKMVREEFLNIAKSTINLQQHLIARNFDGQCGKDLKTAMSVPVKQSEHALFFAYYYSCEWLLALKEIPCDTKSLDRLIGGDNNHVKQAIAFTYQQCHFYTEALDWYEKVSANSLSRQLIVYRGIAKCQQEKSKLSEVNSTFQNALLVCGMKEVDSKFELNPKSELECLDFGMVLLEMGCYNKETENNNLLALRLLFMAMKWLILAAANVAHNKFGLMADFDALFCFDQLKYASNPSRPLAHCLFAISELLNTVNSEYAQQYKDKACALGLEMVSENDSDVMQNMSLLYDLGKMSGEQRHLERGKKFIKQVLNNTDSDERCKYLVCLGDYQVLCNEAHGVTWTRKELDDWYKETTAALEEAYQRDFHIDLAKVHKIYGDLLASSMDNPDDAVAGYGKAKNIFEEVGNKLGVAAVTQSEANILKNNGDKETAEKLFSASQTILEDIFDAKSISTQLITVKEQRAQNLRSLKKYKDAEELNREIEKTRAEISSVEAKMKAEINSKYEPTRDSAVVHEIPNSQVCCTSDEAPETAVSQNKGARSTDDLLSSQNNPSNKSSPQISSRSDKLSASQFTQHAAVSHNGRSNVHEQQKRDRRAARHKALQRVHDERQHVPRIPQWSTSHSTEDSDDEQRSNSNRSTEDLPTKDFDENFPTKDTGPYKNNDSFKSNHSGTSLFYTPPAPATGMRRSNTTSVLQAPSHSDNPVVEQYLESMHHETPRGRSEYAQRMLRGDYVASPKPDLVMGTEHSPRGLVYYDQPTRGSGHHSTSTPKYSNEHPQNSSRSQPTSNMYASLDRAIHRKSRLDSQGPTNPDRRPGGTSIPSQNFHRPVPKPDSQHTSLNNGHYNINNHNTTPQVPDQHEPPQNNGQNGPEDNSGWYEYGCG